MENSFITGGKMKAFVVKFKQLFRMDTEDIVNFNENKRRLLIPLYQREYTWTDEKIVTLVNDIKRYNKYLGNVILDEGETYYEIVDGQQRITTCFLILACLYNKYAGKQREQAVLKRLIMPYDEFILKNDSIGDYISEKKDKLFLTIKENSDVYYQAKDFERAFKTISKEIDKLESHEKILEFKRKLLDCEILVLINDQHDNTHPVEQLFLDINEKAQLLQVEDIFKGHCFENYEEIFHNDLRKLWIQLKKCAMEFKKFGFVDASQYIYLYLLEVEGYKIPANLTLNGKHYLDGMNMDQTESVLKEMIAYGQTNIEFYRNLSNTDYKFVDLCKNSYEYRNTSDHTVLKQMCKIMLESTAAQYQKLPLLYLIHSLRKNEEVVNSITHEQFRKVISNLYIYMMLFIMGGAKKSKKEIDYTIKEAIDGDDKINQILIAAKELRNRKLKEFSLLENMGSDKIAFIYSVIDNYISNKNWLKEIYSNEKGYTLEHFIIPDNRNRRIQWKDGNDTFEFELSTETVRTYKKKMINYLMIDGDLNESLEHDDIVSKIQDIKLWFQRRNVDLPEHVSLVIDYIEQLPQYVELVSLKDGHYSQKIIKEKYNNFISCYFEPDNEMLKMIEEKFIRSFQNS